MKIIRVPCGRDIPSGLKLVQWLGTETNLVAGAASNYQQDVLLVEEATGTHQMTVGMNFSCDSWLYSVDCECGWHWETRSKLEWLKVVSEHGQR